MDKGALDMVREWVKAIIGVACIATPIAFAANTHILTDGAVSVTLTDEPCADLAPKWRKAIYREGRNTVSGCYMKAQGAVLLIWGDGDTHVIPERAFKPLTSL